jgi:serine protease Do/serine protease DegQ
MKIRLLLLSLVVGLVAGGVWRWLHAADPDASAAAASAAAAPLPTVKVDAAALNRANQGAITSYADALEPIRLSVVSVYSTRIVRSRGPGFPYNDPFFRQFFGPQVPDQPSEQRVPGGMGSGVIVSSDGYILTNNHVVEGSDELSVSLPDGRELPARLIGTDPKTDVAVVKIEAQNLPAATLADSDLLRVGDVVFAIGNPLGVGQTTTMGIVSATGRSNLQLLEQGYENFIQTDASINPGNSGGALVDAQGRLVGINTAIISTSRGSIGLGFAIPVNLAANVMRSLIETGAVSRGYLGVSTQELDPDLAAAFGITDGRGVLIREVSPGSPAERAGLRHGDVVTAFNGRVIGAPEAMRLAIAQTAPGATVTLRVVRDREARDVSVVVDRLDDGTGGLGGDEILKGIRVGSLTDEIRREFGIPDEVRGLVVVAVNPDSQFAAVLPVGAVIEQINRQPLSDAATAQAALGRGRNIFVVSYRGERRYLVIVLN